MRDVLLAAVIGAHGLKGEVKVKTFTETPGALARYKRLHAKDGRVFEVHRFLFVIHFTPHSTKAPELQITGGR